MPFFICLFWLPNGTKFTPKHIKVLAFQHRRVHKNIFSNVSMDIEMQPLSPRGLSGWKVMFTSNLGIYLVIFYLKIKIL